MEKYVIIRCAN